MFLTKISYSYFWRLNLVENRILGCSVEILEEKIINLLHWLLFIAIITPMWSRIIGVNFVSLLKLNKMNLFSPGCCLTRCVASVWFSLWFFFFFFTRFGDWELSCFHRNIINRVENWWFIKCPLLGQLRYHLVW